MGVEEWGDICNRYGKILSLASKVRFPTMEEIAGTIPPGSSVIEGIRRREERFTEVLQGALTEHSPLMWYDLCTHQERDRGQTFVIYPSMPSVEIDGVVTLIDENFHRRLNEYWPSDLLFRDMRNVIAERLVQDVSWKKKGKWLGIFPKRIIFDENNITSLIELLRPSENLVVITDEGLPGWNHPNIELNIYSKKRSDPEVILHTEYYIENKGVRYVNELPFSKFKVLGNTSKCFVLNTYDLEEYLDKIIPGWMKEVSLELKKRLIQFAGRQMGTRRKS